MPSFYTGCRRCDVVCLANVAGLCACGRLMEKLGEEDVELTRTVGGVRLSLRKAKADDDEHTRVI